RVEDSLPLSVALRVDDACLRFEAAWQTGTQPSIEEYLKDKVEPEYSVLLWQLLLLELEYRGRVGNPPVLEEYRNRFAGQEELVMAAFRRRERADLQPPAHAVGPAAQNAAASPEQESQTPTGPGVKGSVPWPSIPGYEILAELGRGGMG